MTTLAGADFLKEPNLIKVMTALEAAGGSPKIVGGAVRNSLMGEPVSDIDIATRLLPDAVMALAAPAGLKSVPTGIDHGTVTLVSGGIGFEVTTLRADVETDGRRAVVAFTDDIGKDAGRRDFTINAIYCALNGEITDPTGGVADCAARRVRFIGDARQRIREDYLRILRFFRFSARYGQGAPDAEGLQAAIELQAGIERLSRERVGQEIGKFLTAPGAGAMLAVMKEAGVLVRVFRQPSDVDGFRRLVRLEPETRDIPLLLASLMSDAEAAQGALKLSNADMDTMAAILALAGQLGSDPAAGAVREAVYRNGNARTAAALLLAAAKAGTAVSPEIGIARNWQAPRFPLTGKDLIAEGFSPGPALGAELALRERRWIASGFQMERLQDFSTRSRP